MNELELQQWGDDFARLFEASPRDGADVIATWEQRVLDAGLPLPRHEDPVEYAVVVRRTWNLRHHHHALLGAVLLFGVHR